ncbi:WecB/TagA/CpsF family glycosyltransferase [Marinifilum sp. RC60d5]|uniref:WecB/TagA/CpsF family glycosyltransferase n=1 Tax=Marinifilum sp. RC60d5 TaxID=3458414 RepID=UPI004036C6DB
MKEIVRQIINTNDYPLQTIFNEKRKIYTFLNPVSYLLASNQKDKFHQFDGIFADGGILSLFTKTYYRKTVKRRSFDMTSVASLLLEHIVKNKKTIYFVGAKKNEITNSMVNINKIYPDLNIVGSRDGYFNGEVDRKNTIKDIISKNPDYLIVGMGTPMQEDFLVETKNSGFLGIGFTCGGFIHQIAMNKLDYYPVLFDKLNIRWIYRFYKEKHTRRRYVESAFVFPLKFTIDFFSRN